MKAALGPERKDVSLCCCIALAALSGPTTARCCTTGTSRPTPPELRHPEQVGSGSIKQVRLAPTYLNQRLIHASSPSARGDQALVQPFSTLTMVLPRLAGDSATVIPAAFIASILSSAPPLPPAMMAPAWPIRRPGGAVRPAMNPTTGFLRLADLMSAAASS